MPGCRSEGVLLYLHGGGYVAGSAVTYRLLVAEVEAETAERVGPGLRLAPEHPFPATLVDAWLAYWRLLAAGFDPDKIAIAGDSAGGGLSLALLLALRDAGLPLPAAGVCLSPWTDLALTAANRCSTAMPTT